MNLLNTSLLNGIAVLIKTATLFILNKILALYVGPSGYAVIGQFQNFIQMVMTFGGNLINTAVVKYTAEYNDNLSKQVLVWRAAGSLVLLLSTTFSLIILIFQKKISLYFFHTVEYQSVLIWFATFLILFNLNAFFLAILNGKKEILKLVTANIIGSLISLIVTVVLAMKYSLYGALIAISIYQSINFFITVFLCYRAKWFKISYLFGNIEKKIAKNFLAFALMALVSAICMPLTQIVIRSYLSKEFGLNYAGYWEAMIRLSAGYLMLVTTTLGVYYLPRLAELTELNKIKKEVYLGYKFILPLAVTGGLCVYLLRDWIIPLLFSDAFMPMRDLFLWQMVGDSLKIGSWILAYLMLSKKMTKLFVSTELVFTLSLILMTYIFTKIYGFKGVSIAYLLNYALYWIMLSKMVFRKLKTVCE